MVLFQRKLYFSKVSEGVHPFYPGGPPFSRGSNFFQGVQLPFSIETNILLVNFQGGGGGVGPPIPPLDPHMKDLFCMAMGVP